MSTPPSPRRTLPSDYPSASGSLPVSSSSTGVGGPIAGFAPGLATTLPPTTQPALPPAFSDQAFGAGLYPFPPPLAPTGSVATPQHSGVLPRAYSSAPSESSVAGAAGPALRGGRRSKTHVASACVNCKRAHLSCDVQRPCARCVASGKQDTCVDVQHKKRGRPRLREESGSSAPQALPEGSSTSDLAAGPSQTTPRPIAGGRRARAESFRSLRSQASEESGPSSIPASTPNRPLATSMLSPYSIRPPPAPPTTRPAFEAATALLNTDLVIIRANRPFEQIMLSGRSVKDRNIADLAVPVDGENFQHIKNRLRAEREAREPAYMPPIVQPGQDPVLRIAEPEAEQYAQGFNDHTYTWRRSQFGASAETFPARVRLAKATAYFVVVTLPSFRPVDQPSPPVPQPPPFTYSGPLMAGPPLRSPEAFAPPVREPSIQYAAPIAPFSSQGPVPPFPTRPAPYYTYPPPPPPPMPPQQHGYPSFPSLTSMPSGASAQPFPPAPTGFPPRSMMQDYAQRPTGTAMQLPPLTAGPRTVATGPSAAQTSGDGSSEEGGGEGEGADRRLGSPRKRRRIGIDDVLHR
ncbi:hypothetical protein LTR53_004660 [Teratosphaeriaceae sp. CCFEE 6253]|nr:hypothetical protein LTR53_004660 [Teratosphaeriaceae sp. CCFEE 6253]